MSEVLIQETKPPPKDETTMNFPKFVVMIFFASLSAIASAVLATTVLVVFAFFDAQKKGDPTAGEAVQLYLICPFVLPIAVIGGIITMSAAFLLFKRSFLEHLLLSSVIAGTLGGLVPSLICIISIIGDFLKNSSSGGS